MPGAEVTIAGAGFAPGTEVYLNGRLVPATTLGEATLRFLVPADAATGPANLFILAPSGMVSLDEAFLIGQKGKLALLGVSPEVVPLSTGGDVTLFGAEFGADMTVTVVNQSAGGEPTPVTLVSLEGTAMAVVKIPPGDTAGFLTIAITRGAGEVKADGLLAYSAPPVLSALSPQAGPTAGGDSVVITGGGFDEFTRVFFGDTETVVLDVLSDTELVALVPAGEAGFASVRVLNTDGQAGSLPEAYRYLASVAGGARLVYSEAVGGAANLVSRTVSGAVGSFAGGAIIGQAFQPRKIAGSRTASVDPASEK